MGNQKNKLQEDRRRFLKQSVLASASLFVPQFLNGMNFSTPLSNYKGKRLVVIQLSGGNDGLNTLIPYRNDMYYSSRPTVAIKRNEALRINDEYGLNPNMKAFKELYDDGLLSIVSGVGYPNPNRSHFTSMDVWHSASLRETEMNSGWLGRYLDSQCGGCDHIYHALDINDSLHLALRGKLRNGFAAKRPETVRNLTRNRFIQSSADHHGSHDDHHHDHVDYLYKTLVDTRDAAEYLHQQGKIYKSKVRYPNSKVAKDLKQVAELINSGTETQIYYVSHGSFDTHTAQKSRQGRLLKQYADGLRAFLKDLKAGGTLDDTLVMTFSEFGRRVKQNGSNGTDHGAANVLFMAGGSLRKKGLINTQKSALTLENGDLKYNLDFRRVYADVLGNWLQADAQAILGERFQPLGLV